MRPRQRHLFGCRRSARRQAHGFSILELAAVVAVISLLIFLILPALAKAQTKMRSNRCLSNLQDIGTAMSLYLLDCNDKYPYAALRYCTGADEHHLAWDDLMGPYMGIDLATDQRDRDGVSSGGSFKMLTCPEDVLPVKITGDLPRKEFRRSYSMPEHNMGVNTVAGREATAADWPPCPVNRTGMGLKLDGRPGFVSTKWNQDDEPGSKQAPRWQAAFQTSMIMDQANTLFMTEQFDGFNHVGAWNGATIGDISAHFAVDPAQPTQARINYLMVDGHVESMEPKNSYVRKHQGASGSAPAGIWTVWQDD